MRRLGDINFLLEDYINEQIVQKNKSILSIFSSLLKELSNYKNNQEIYENNKSPILFYNNKKVKKTKSNKKLNLLVKEYIKHDLQWGEIIFIVYGYLHIHYNSVKRIQYKWNF